ncbi:AAA family ATPase [Candidatus Woesearchaeota archaeon]|nr:AAA family ATPase [Candidatus Woesearchaeota archaeon]
MATKEDDIINKVMSHYTIDISSLEEENRLLKDTVTSLREELTKFNRAPLLVADIKDIIGENALLRLNNGNEFFVDISSNCRDILPGHTVLVEQKNLTIVKKIDSSKKFNVEKFVIIEKPTVSWDDVGGLTSQIQDIKEVIELPLLKPELFKKVGIQPPKGVLLHGPPGSGKTLLAKAVASSTNSTFIEVVGSELVQKFIGEGSKLVKEIFELAREKAPSIVFIDEIDAIAATRVDVGTSGEREVQRTFMQLLAEVDGFKSLGNVKIIGCTNRKDILDPAVLRPGRLDRLIEVPYPDKDAVIDIFKIHSKPMRLDKKINLDTIQRQLVGLSGAEIRAVCTEAGYFAIREERIVVTEMDLLHAVKKVRQEEGDTSYKGMFG